MTTTRFTFGEISIQDMFNYGLGRYVKVTQHQAINVNPWSPELGKIVPFAYDARVELIWSTFLNTENE